MNAEKMKSIREWREKLGEQKEFADAVSRAAYLDISLCNIAEHCILNGGTCQLPLSISGDAVGGPSGAYLEIRLFGVPEGGGRSVVE